LLLSFGPGLLVALCTVAAYIADVTWLRAPRHGSPPAMPGLGFWGQVAVFLAAYVLLGGLTARLRAAGAEREGLQSELRRVRLRADEILRNIRSGVITVDDAGRLAFINPMAERLLELDGETMTGLP